MSVSDKRKKKRGMSPGSLIFTGEQKVDKTKISLIQYDSTKHEEKESITLKDLPAIKESTMVSWINISGLHDTETINKIGEIFGIHSLVLEDILNVEHSPKIDDYENFIFIISKMIDVRDDKLNIEHIAFILGQNFVITFQEDHEDVFELIRARIRTGKGRIGTLGADYLLYRLLDSLVDNYFIVNEKFDQRIEEIEDYLLENSEMIELENIHRIRKEVLKMKRAVSPMIEIIHSLERERGRLLHKNTYLFLRDLYDHSKQIMETLDNYREIINGLQELILSSSSHKMNEVMKLLTIISTIFIPLTFIVGIYGMNFNTEASRWNMPELNWIYGYPVIMLIMLAIGISLLFFFKKKKWL